MVPPILTARRPRNVNGWRRGFDARKSDASRNQDQSRSGGGRTGLDRLREEKTPTNIIELHRVRFVMMGGKIIKHD